jgi:SAM-dependent methyltransferase
MKPSSMIVKWARAVRRRLRSPLVEHALYQELFRGQVGLEVGGPSELFRRVLPIYEVAAAVDGANFSSTTIWEGAISAGRTFEFMTGRVGLQYIAEATDLSVIPSARYDFVISSNCLEHVANPLKAVGEWLRVLRSGGHLLLVLPRKESNFDHHRPITEFSHLLQDFEFDMSEHDLTHLDEILKLHDYARDPPAGDRAQMNRRSLANFDNRCLHHHVFDQGLIEEVFRHFGLVTLHRTTTKTDHIAVARKPA